MKKTVLLIAGLLALAACQAEDKKDTLVVGHSGEMQSLDPVFSYDGISHGLLLNLYDTLLKLNGTSMMELLPSISEQVPSIQNGLISKDGKTYTFPIRKGIKFHDGTELTPDDVRYSLLRFMLSDIAGGPSSLLLEPILGISSTRDENGKIVVDFKEAAKAVRVEGDKVVVRLKRPFAPFLGIIARWGYIMPRKWVAEHGGWDGEEATWKEFNNFDKQNSYLFDHVNGSGPFKLVRWDIPGRRVQLAANEDYFDGAPKLKNIHMISINEPSTMRLMLEGGEVDVAEIFPQYADQVAGKPGIVVHGNLPRLRTDPVFFFTLDINAKGNPEIGSGKLDGQGIPPDFFTDKDLRKAFAYAFDYDAYLEQSLGGRGERAHGPAPEGVVSYVKDIPFYEFDLKKAEEHFKKAWGGEVWEKGFKFTLTYNTGGVMRQSAAEILKRNVEALNPKFHIDVRGITWATFLEKTATRQMPMWLRGWVADYADAHNFFFAFMHSDGRYALAQGYKNPEADRLVRLAVEATDPADRADYYRQLSQIAREDAVQIYTVHPTGMWVLRDYVKGFYDNPVFMGLYFYPMYK